MLPNLLMVIGKAKFTMEIGGHPALEKDQMRKSKFHVWQPEQVVF